MLMAVGKTPSIMAKDTVRQMYQTSYGIFDHIAQYQKEKHNKDPSIARPLASLAHHPAEDIAPFRLYSEYVRLFPQLKIKERYGMTLDEFLKRPSWQVAAIIEECRRLNSEESTVTAGVKNEMDKVLGKK